MRPPEPALGIVPPSALSHRTARFSFEPGDTLLLHTDGLAEPRSPDGDLYPLAERVAAFSPAGPEALIRDLQRDLVEFTGEPPSDEIAILAVERTPAHHHRHQVPTPQLSPARARNAVPPSGAVPPVGPRHPPPRPPSR